MKLPGKLGSTSGGPRGGRVAAVSDTFHERFGLLVDTSEAQRRFCNRIDNEVFRKFYTSASGYPHDFRRELSNTFGERFTDKDPWDYARKDFLCALQVVEGMYRASSVRDKERLSGLVEDILGRSELDLGVRWVGGRFIRAGARLLDDKLVREPLQWLSAPQYEHVLIPFAKGLRHLLEVANRPEVSSDVITDMYEAVEALAKIVTGRDRDLSGNRELLLSRLKTAEEYKPLLRWYIEYANEFRHAADRATPKPSLSPPEVESFIYLTGIFIRLAVQRAEPSSTGVTTEG